MTPSSDTPMTPIEQLKPCPSAFKKGDRVKVFNQVSENWMGTILRINKKTACVRTEDANVFSNHQDARSGEPNEYLVPFRDLMDPEKDYFSEAVSVMNSEAKEPDTELADLRAKLAETKGERDIAQLAWCKAKEDLSAAQLQLRVMRDALRGMLNADPSNPMACIWRAKEALANASTTDLQSAIDGAAGALKDARRNVDGFTGSFPSDSEVASLTKQLEAALAQLAPFVSPNLPPAAKPEQ